MAIKTKNITIQWRKKKVKYACKQNGVSIFVRLHLRYELQVCIGTQQTCIAIRVFTDFMFMEFVWVKRV